MPFCSAVSAVLGETRRRRRALRGGACRLRGAREMSTCPGPDLPGHAVLDRVLDQRLQQQARARGVSSVSGWMSNRTTSRSANRVCSISRYFDSAPSSASSVISCWPRCSSVIRSRSLSCISTRSAARTSLCISDEIACSVLKRKCGMQLLLQGLQLRGDQLGLELRRAELAGARLPVVEERVAEPDDRPVGHHFPVEVEERRALHLRPPGVAARPAECASHQCTRFHAGDVREREDDDRGNVHRQRAQPGGRARTGSAARARSPTGAISAQRYHQLKLRMISVLKRRRPLPEEPRELPRERGRQHAERGRDDEDVSATDAVAATAPRRQIGAGAADVEQTVRGRFHDRDRRLRPHGERGVFR